LEDIKNNPDKIKDLDEKDLKSFLDQAKDGEDYDMVITLAQKLKSKKSVSEDVDADPELQKQLAEDALKQDQENAEAQKTILEKQEKEKKDQLDQVESLKKQLEDSEQQKKTLEELIKNFEEYEKNNRQENSKLLEDIKAAKES
jgi:predicted phage-related endonuclease